MAADIRALVGSVLEEAVDTVVAERVVALWVNEEDHVAVHVAEGLADGTLFFAV